jgi:hypothetical protein
MNYKIVMLAAALLVTQGAAAQIRVSGMAGPAFATGSKKSDTAFFADRHFSQQLKIGIHKGKLGFTIGGSLLQQKPGDVATDGRLPKLDTGQAAGQIKNSFTGGNVTTTLFSAGPEICFPLGKLKMHIRIAGGIASTRATPAQVLQTRPGLQVPETGYSSRIDKSSTGLLQTGLSFQYPLTKKLSLDVNSDYLGYKIKYLNRDKRNSQGVTTEQAKEQQKQLVNVSGGLTFKF